MISINLDAPASAVDRTGTANSAGRQGLVLRLGDEENWFEDEEDAYGTWQRMAVRMGWETVNEAGGIRQGVGPAIGDPSGLARLAKADFD